MNTTCQQQGHDLGTDPDVIDSECPNHVCKRCGEIGKRCGWDNIRTEFAEEQLSV